MTRSGRCRPSRFFCGREQNEFERRALIEQIALEERPAFLVHLGDMVSFGASGQEWEYFDRLVSPLTVRRIRILPVLGNHDLYGERALALGHARQRFPELAQGEWYAMRHHDLGLVWLNSNLNGERGRRQAAWFKDVLGVFDGPGTRGVLVFLHHPVYTNGKHRHGEAYVISELLPPFLAAKKSLVMMSGHVHGYERFYAEGRRFVVSGGGGGPRVEYAVKDERVSVSSYDTPTGEPRPFHYVLIEEEKARLHFTAKCLKKDAGCASGVLDEFFRRALGSRDLTMVTAAQMRKLALALPEVEEKSHFGKPDFRVRNKIFAGLSADGGQATLKLVSKVQSGLVKSRPETFSFAPGAWGRSGWTFVELAHVPQKELRELLLAAWRLIAPKTLVADYDARAPQGR